MPDTCVEFKDIFTLQYRNYAFRQFHTRVQVQSNGDKLVKCKHTFDLIAHEHLLFFILDRTDASPVNM